MRVITIFSTLSVLMNCFSAEISAPVQQPLELSSNITQQHEQQEMMIESNNKKFNSVNLVVNQGHLLEAMKDSGIITSINSDISEYTLEVPLKGSTENYSINCNVKFGDAIIPLTVNGTFMGFISTLVVKEKQKSYEVSLMEVFILFSLGYIILKAVFNCLISGTWDTFETNIYNNAMYIAATYGDICYSFFTHLRNGKNNVDFENYQKRDYTDEKVEDNIKILLP